MEDPKLSQARIPPGILTGLIGLADQYRAGTTGWFAGTGLDRDSLEQVRALVSYRQAIIVIRRALKALPSGPLGLIIGCRDPLLTWGTLGTAVRSASTGAEARRVAIDYHQCAGTLMDYVASSTDDEITIELLPRTPEPDLLVFLTEEALAGIVILAKLMFGASASPLSAHLSYPPPPWASEYKRLWRCPVAFDCERTTLSFPRELDDRRVSTANATHFEAALSATQAILDIEPVNDLVAAVESILRAGLRSRMTAARVADALSVSPRTLHRRLSEAGHTFGAIQDRVRRQQADVLLMQTRKSITAIAAELGYSDTREFRRAYKRWTDVTPSQVRQQSEPGNW
ncbi:AraC family transcriptional regulator [Nocardia anaemiae]|uniref:AraC family transcriptional regulator n=1 Tax=Nocardia anaemiae TaxID=263910 RepID=UPI0007A432F2|nr:AraC family transcriptional regulator [Nocardia anaemiae]